LERARIKLVYFPTAVNIGLFRLSFNSLKESLSLEIALRQTSIYENVPTDFKQLLEEIRATLHHCYQNIRNNYWDIDEMLASYQVREEYEEYKCSTKLATDFHKLQSYLEVISSKCP
jgi:hypothetical protein